MQKELPGRGRARPPWAKGRSGPSVDDGPGASVHSCARPPRPVPSHRIPRTLMALGATGLPREGAEKGRDAAGILGVPETPFPTMSAPGARGGGAGCRRAAVDKRATHPRGFVTRPALRRALRGVLPQPNPFRRVGPPPCGNAPATPPVPAERRRTRSRQASGAWSLGLPRQSEGSNERMGPWARAV